MALFMGYCCLESESNESLEQLNSDDEKVDIMDFDEEALSKMSPETRAM